MSTSQHLQHGPENAIKTRPRTVRAAFTLLEILIVVVILGILAAIITPQFSSASQESSESSTARSLQIIRTQIELYRAEFFQDPDLIDGQWDDLVHNDYLHSAPRNTINRNIAIGPAPAAGIGWVWRDSGNGVWGIYATDSTSLAEFVD